MINSITIALFVVTLEILFVIISFKICKHIIHDRKWSD